MTRSTIWLVGGALLVLGGIAVAGSGSSSPKRRPPPAPRPPPPRPPPTPKPPGSKPQPGAVPPLPPPPAPSPGPDPDLHVIDMRDKAPAEYIRNDRAVSEVRAIVLHQTGFQWKPTNPKWAEVRAHFVILFDGTILMNFDPRKQLRYGSNHANPFCITIEHEGNYGSSDGKFFQPEKFGKSYLADAPKLVAASKALIKWLKDAYPITHVYAHRQWDNGKGNCCGPEIWRTIGQWAISALGLSDGGPGWHYDNGLAIPDSWRVAA